MKKVSMVLIALLVCFGLTMSLAACGGGSEAPASTAPAPASTAPAPEPADDGGEEEYFSQDFDITNSTGVDIMEMYIAPSDADDWGEDVLGEDVFADGDTYHMSSDLEGTADATWDFYVIDADGDEITFEGINLSSVTAVDLHWGDDGTTPTATTTTADGGAAAGGEEEYFNQDLDITNDTGVDIMEMYISPTGVDEWGDDMLGDEIFAAGETRHFSTELVGTADATWDIKIIDADGDEVDFTGISFSSSSALSLSWGDDGATPTVTMN